MSFVGRNEKCPCGSQQKYKKCCLVKDEEMKFFENPLARHAIAKIDPNLENEIDNVLIKMSKSGASSV